MLTCSGHPGTSPGGRQSLGAPAAVFSTQCCCCLPSTLGVREAVRYPTSQRAADSVTSRGGEQTPGPYPIPVPALLVTDEEVSGGRKRDSSSLPHPPVDVNPHPPIMNTKARPGVH